MMGATISVRPASQHARRAWTLAALSLLVAALGVAAMFARSGGCARYEELRGYALEQGAPGPQSCFAYLLDRSIIPSLAISLPFLFCAAMLGYKEKRHFSVAAARGGGRQELLAYRSGIVAAALLLLATALIRSIRCEGFGCLGLAPLIALTLSTFPPLLLASVLSFARVRYEWPARQFPIAAVILAVLTGLAYTHLLGA
jgi:hypothetical protein